MPFDFLKRRPPAQSPPPSAALAAAPNAAPQPTIKELSQSMCDRKAVHWAAESAKLTGKPLSPKDQAALQAAHAWLQNPTSQAKAEAQKAALAAGHQGPGAWAAQAAAWAAHGQNPSPTAIGLSAKVKQLAALKGSDAHGSLAAKAVAGAVALAAAKKAGAAFPQLPKVPAKQLPVPRLPSPSAASAADLAKIAEAHKPFIELGQKILADKSVKC